MTNTVSEVWPGEGNPMTDQLERNNSPSPSDDEDDRAILFLQTPFGDAPDQREHQWAVDYLVDHAERMHPRLLALLRRNEATNPYAIIDALAVMGRPESIPALEDLMRNGPTNLARAAANALGRHPDGAALSTLLNGIQGGRPETVSAIADALYERGDNTACPALLSALDHPDPIVRYHLIQAAAALDCLDRVAIAGIAQHDPDASIQELAQRVLEQSAG